MTREETLILFKSLDDPKNWECPNEFEFRKAIERFKKFVEDFDSATGIAHDFETESYIQDASFHSQINLGNGWLRFSNFGDMVAVTPEAEIPLEQMTKIEELLVSHGYVFVNTEYAEVPYTGQNRGVDGIPDWWTRYFDWV